MNDIARTYTLNLTLRQSIGEGISSLRRKHSNNLSHGQWTLETVFSLKGGQKRLMVFSKWGCTVYFYVVTETYTPYTLYQRSLSFLSQRPKVRCHRPAYETPRMRRTDTTANGFTVKTRLYNNVVIICFRLKKSIVHYLYLMLVISP